MDRRFVLFIFLFLLLIPVCFSTIVPHYEVIDGIMINSTISKYNGNYYISSNISLLDSVKEESIKANYSLNIPNNFNLLYGTLEGEYDLVKGEVSPFYRGFNIDEDGNYTMVLFFRSFVNETTYYRGIQEIRLNIKNGDYEYSIRYVWRNKKRYTRAVKSDYSRNFSSSVKSLSVDYTSPFKPVNPREINFMEVEGENSETHNAPIRTLEEQEVIANKSSGITILGSDGYINVFGCVETKDHVPVSDATVIVFDDDFALTGMNDEIGRGLTDSNGCFE